MLACCCTYRVCFQPQSISVYLIYCITRLFSRNVTGCQRHRSKLGHGFLKGQSTRGKTCLQLRWNVLNILNCPCRVSRSICSWRTTTFLLQIVRCKSEASEVQSSSRPGITCVTQSNTFFLFDVTLNACFIPFGQASRKCFRDYSTLLMSVNMEQMVSDCSSSKRSL